MSSTRTRTLGDNVNNEILGDMSLERKLSCFAFVVTLPHFLSVKDIPTRTEQVVLGHPLATLTFRFVFMVFYVFVVWCAICQWCGDLSMQYDRVVCSVTVVYIMTVWCALCSMTVWCEVWGSGVQYYCGVHYDCVVCSITAWYGERLCGVQYYRVVCSMIV